MGYTILVSLFFLFYEYFSICFPSILLIPLKATVAIKFKSRSQKSRRSMQNEKNKYRLRSILYSRRQKALNFALNLRSSAVSIDIIREGSGRWDLGSSLYFAHSLFPLPFFHAFFRFFVTFFCFLFEATFILDAPIFRALRHFLFASAFFLFFSICPSYLSLSNVSDFSRIFLRYRHPTRGRG